MFEQLHVLGREIAQLECYVKSSFETLDNHFQAYIEQINLLSSLIEFQRKVVHYRTPEDMSEAAFNYVDDNVGFDEAFLCLDIGSEKSGNNVVAADQAKKSLYERFLNEDDNGTRLRRMIEDKDLGMILSNVDQFQSDQISWQMLEAKSAIVFPLRVQGKFLGFGVMIRRRNPFLLNQLSFINLILGMLSLLVFQHYYLFHLKRKLFKQVKLQKVLEKVTFAEYFDQGPLFIYSLDQRGTILHANNAALERINREKALVVGESFMSFLAEADRKPVENLLNRLQLGELRFSQGKMLPGGSEELICDFYMTKMELHDRFNLNIIFAVDVTDKFYQQQLEQRNRVLDSVGQVARRLNSQLNDLLSVAVPHVSLLQARLEDPQDSSSLKAVESALDKTGSMARKFLNYDMTDIERPMRIQLNDLLRDTAMGLQDGLPGSVRFEFSLDPGIPQLKTFPRRLTQLVKILTQNSLEAVGNKGTVRYTTQLVFRKKSGVIRPQYIHLPKGRFIEFAVHDTGGGIPADELNDIFRPFYSNKIKNDSLGMGLFIAYSIVKDLNGEIIARSNEGLGSSFYVYIPIEEVRETPRKVVPQNGERRRPSILIVDDEYTIREMLEDIFSDQHFNVHTAGDGKEGVELFKQHQDEIDLVILDMVMPHMGGKEAFNEIRALNPSQKVIMMSGFSKEEDLQELMMAGVVAFMSKPFQVKEIVTRVKKALQDVPSNGSAQEIHQDPA